MSAGPSKKPKGSAHEKKRATTLHKQRERKRHSRKEEARSKWEEACDSRKKMISKLANFLESKDWSTVLNTAAGDSHSPFCDEEDIPVTVDDLSKAQVMDLTIRASLLHRLYTELNSLRRKSENMYVVAEWGSIHACPKVHARTLLRWKRDFELGGFTFIPSKKGRHQRPWILTDEAFKMKARTFIMENAAPKGIPNMKVTDFQIFVNTVLLKDVDVQSLNGIRAPISKETARKWLYKLGCTSKYISSGVYFDGHDREDVLEYRDSWLARRQESEKYMPLYLHINMHEAKELLCTLDPESGEKVECNEMLISEVTLPKELWDNQEVPVLEFHVDDVRFDFSKLRMDKDKYPLGGLSSKKIDWTHPSSKRLIHVVQDESIYKSYAAQSKAWFLKDQQVIRKKGEGRGVMASGFLTEVSGMILLCNEDLQHINNTIKGKWCKIVPMT